MTTNKNYVLVLAKRCFDHNINISKHKYFVLLRLWAEADQRDRLTNHLGRQENPKIIPWKGRSKAAKNFNDKKDSIADPIAQAFFVEQNKTLKKVQQKIADKKRNCNKKTADMKLKIDRLKKEVPRLKLTMEVPTYNEKILLLPAL